MSKNVKNTEHNRVQKCEAEDKNSGQTLLVIKFYYFLTSLAARSFINVV